MLTGLTEREFHELLLSVGKTAKGLRPLSPVEVGILCNKSLAAGSSRKAVATGLQMTTTTMVSKFLRLLKLAPEVQHLISWGRSNGGALGFSVAAELARMEIGNHEVVADGILKYDLAKSELMSVIQLLERSGQTVEECIERVVRRRGGVRIRHVVLGAVGDEQLQRQLAGYSQVQRDRALSRVVEQLFPATEDVVSKLGLDRFTLVGGKKLAAAVAAAPHFESDVARELASELGKQGATAVLVE